MLFLNQYLNHWLIHEIILLFFLYLVFLVYLILILVYIILLVFFSFSFSSSNICSSSVLTAIIIFSSNFSLAISSFFRCSILCISISNFCNLSLTSSVCSRSYIAISLASSVFSIPLGFDIFI